MACSTKNPLKIQELWLDGKNCTHLPQYAPTINFAGRQEYGLDKKIHREEGPAVTWATGQQEWWINGYRHREDGPATIQHDGSQEWWLNGYRHREDGPAIIYCSCGTQEWWLNGYRHRLDAPAVIYRNGDTEWWHEGKLHRLNGPALHYSLDGTNCHGWYINGIEINEKNHPFIIILRRYSLYDKWKNNKLTDEDWVLIKCAL